VTTGHAPHPPPAEPGCVVPIASGAEAKSSTPPNKNTWNLKQQKTQRKGETSTQIIPCREWIHIPPTLRKGKSSTQKAIFWGIC